MPGYEDSAMLRLQHWTRMEGPFSPPPRIRCSVNRVQGHDQAEIWLGGAGWLFHARVPTGE